MLSVIAAALTEGSALTESADVSTALSLGRGVIVGAYVMGAAFLAGFAAIRQSALAFFACIMVLTAGALEFSWLGFLPSLSADGTIFILGLFAASALVFVSALVNAPGVSPLLGGLIFVGALVFAGLGVINFVDRIQVAALMQWGAIGAGVFAGAVILLQAWRGDLGARLIVPGAALALAAPVVGPLGALEGASAAALAAHGLFAFGVLSMSLVTITETSPVLAAQPVPAPAEAPVAFAPSDHHLNHEEIAAYDAAQSGADEKATRERAEVVIDSQLGRVLDYAGVGIWDWSPEFADQTESAPALLGAQAGAALTPAAVSALIHEDDLGVLEAEVFAAQDGPFDVVMKRVDGRAVRIRGARAANESEGALERIVAFIEFVDAKFAQSDDAAVADKPVAQPSETADFDVSQVAAVFQPIVSFETMKTVGFEALARNKGEESDTEALLRNADAAGKSGALALTMLRQSAEFLASRLGKSEDGGAVFVAMNLSWSQMSDPAFAGAFEKTMQSFNLPKGALVLELTEGEAVGDHETAAPVFARLKALGARLAFDDFGAGFSCLSNVRRYDFDFIKIDKSFAEDLETQADGAKIVAALAAMGRDLGLKVIIEGIESEAAGQIAARLGCAYGQGFALGRPAAALSVVKFSNQPDPQKPRGESSASVAFSTVAPDEASASGRDSAPSRYSEMRHPAPPEKTLAIKA